MRWEKYHTLWAIMIFGWVTNYMVRSSLSPLLIPILQEFKLTYAQAGILATAFFYAYTFMQFPAGHLGDRVGEGCDGLFFVGTLSGSNFLCLRGDPYLHCKTRLPLWKGETNSESMMVMLYKIGWKISRLDGSIYFLKLTYKQILVIFRNQLIKKQVLITYH